MEWSPDGIIAYVQLSCESEADCGVHRGNKSIDDRIRQHRWARQRREISLCRRLPLSFCW
jgi:hypothetical protein